MNHLDPTSMEKLHDAFDRAGGNKPTRRLLASVTYKNGVMQAELAECHDTARRTILRWPDDSIRTNRSSKQFQMWSIRKEAKTLGITVGKVRTDRPRTARGGGDRLAGADTGVRPGVSRGNLRRRVLVSEFPAVVERSSSQRPPRSAPEAGVSDTEELHDEPRNGERRWTLQ